MNTSKPKLSSKPPVRSVDDFIADAERKPAEDAAPLPAPRPSQPQPAGPAPEARLPRPAGRRGVPWERPSIREDVKKPYNLRLPEAYLLKLKYIAEKTPDSMQTFCLSVLLPAIDRKVGELLDKET